MQYDRMVMAPDTTQKVRLEKSKDWEEDGWSHLGFSAETTVYWMKLNGRKITNTSVSGKYLTQPWRCNTSVEQKKSYKITFLFTPKRSLKTFAHREGVCLVQTIFGQGVTSDAVVRIFYA